MRVYGLRVRVCGLRVRVWVESEGVWVEKIDHQWVHLSGTFKFIIPAIMYETANFIYVCM